MPDVREIQYTLAHYTLDRNEAPLGHLSRPENAAWYRRLVQNNFYNTLSQAFPIAERHLGEEAFETLSHRFLSQNAHQTPQIWKLPAELVAFVQTQGLGAEWDAPWLQDLLVFEWMEIAIHTQADEPLPSHNPAGALAQDALVLNPYAALLELSYPVHRPVESPTEWLGQQGPFYVLFFRHLETDEVEMVELSPLYALLIEQLAHAPATLPAFAAHWAAQVGTTQEELLAHALGFADHLYRIGALLGTV